ncbi:hypothetical protein OF83DRAFT_1283702 [Amylostereum chailletii]|nr:hypothetical protein OF83DRAFT_1283702 [Amylostereum chailletii]
MDDYLQVCARNFVYLFLGTFNYTPEKYERASYYNGITGDGDHPELVYRSDFLTTPTCATKEDLANPAEFDSEGQRFLIVGKDSNATDVTVGCYAGLVSFTRNEGGIESVELGGIYNSGVKSVEAFSAKGDSGSPIWHTTNGKARIVGQLHSGNNKGGSTSNHVTYCTPGWYLLPVAGPNQEEVRARRLLPHRLVSLRTTSSAFYSPSPRFFFYDSFCCLGAQLSINYWLAFGAGQMP